MKPSHPPRAIRRVPRLRLEVAIPHTRSCVKVPFLFEGALLIGTFASCTTHATGMPSPSNSTTPGCISLVGHTGTTPARAIGQFEVIIRDLANNPQVGAEVSIDLSLCTDLTLAADQLDPDAIVDCAHHKVTKFTGADGSVRFTVLGGSNGAGNATGLNGVGKIYWGGFLIGSPTVSAYDLDGSAGVGANDLSAWLADFSLGVPFGRCDYDCSGGVGANDLSF